MQPITLWQGIAAASIVGIIAALGGGVWRWSGATTRIADVLTALLVNRGAGNSLASVGLEHAALVLAVIVACLVVAPLALYFTLADD